ncbi:response regulator [Marinicellulosiphila megalodicopiae]|uniref:response regulator n=1 Tax=Marinicellulosiphila megalodicopiae TaxID=2724896 RepID=UPI003BAF29C7
MLLNVVGNAIKFTQVGSIQIVAKTNVVSNNQFKLSCSVIDTGIGIEGNKIGLLFEKFTQADNSTTRKYGGTGLGLSIVKKLTELMGGGVSVESEAGVGSKFEFDVLIKGEVDSQFNQDLIDKYCEIKVAVVVEDPSKQINIEQQFSRFAVNVSKYNNFNDVIQSVESEQYDLILIDETFVIDNNGYDELLKKNNNNSFKIVVLTSLHQKQSGLHYQYSYPKPTILKDIIYCLDLVRNVDNKQGNLIIENELIQDKSDQEKIKVLLVEDNFVNQQVALSLFEQLDCEVDIAENGQQALDILNKKINYFDIVFMDCQMPVMDGYTASHQIRLGKAGSENSEIVIVALTANAMKGDKEKCIASGMTDYLSKPIDENELTEIVNKYIKR